MNRENREQCARELRREARVDVEEGVDFVEGVLGQGHEVGVGGAGAAHIVDKDLEREVFELLDDGGDARFGEGVCVGDDGADFARGELGREGGSGGGELGGVAAVEDDVEVVGEQFGGNA